MKVLPEKKTIHVYRGSIPGEFIDDYGTVEQLIKWLRGLLDKVPAEYKYGAALSFEFDANYEGPDGIVVSVSYVRPWTVNEAFVEVGKIAKAEKERLESEVCRLEAKLAVLKGP